MKLLMCSNCFDVFNLDFHKIKKCGCGQCAGKYTDKLNAVYVGETRPLIINNESLSHALKLSQKWNVDRVFESLVSSPKEESFRKISCNDTDIAHILKWCRSHITPTMSVDEVVDEVYHKCCVGGGDLTTRFLARNSPRQDLWDYVCAKNLLGQPLFE
jgi:hypothetical protein